MDCPSYLGDREVISSGVLIAQMNEIIKLHFFKNNPQEPTGFLISIGADNSSPKITQEKVDEMLLINYSRPWLGGQGIGNSGGLIGSDDGAEGYELRFVTSFVGVKDNYLTTFTYIVVAR